MSETTDRYEPRPFGGDYSDEDEPKMLTDLARVLDFFCRHPNRWYSKEEIRIGCGFAPGKDITCRARDLRKKKFGNWEIKREKIGNHYAYMFTGKHNPEEQ
jgi:hypothetical protein